MNIPGLPEGVQVVRFGIARPDEYEILGGSIIRGKREGTVSQVIVQPALGYAFIDQKNGTFAPAKLLEVPKQVTVMAKFLVSNQWEQKEVDRLVQILKEAGATEVSLS